MNGADVLCDVLLANGIDVCFANPGTSEMHFVAALDRKPAMRCVLGLFEGVVTGAADGYARMAGRPAATLLHLGPGLANGLANLHNARRARTPMVNVVGDHATWHLANDAPLTSDIESLAAPMSVFVRRIRDTADVAPATQEAIRAALELRGPATLILPGDAAWSEAGPDRPAPMGTPSPPRVDDALLREVAGAIRSTLRSGRRVDLVLSQGALRGDALATAGRLAGLPGLRVMSSMSNARMERGRGRVAVSRVPYPIAMGMELFAETAMVVLAGASRPVAFFAYPGKSGRLIPDEAPVLTLGTAADDLADALARLADALGAPAAVSGVVDGPDDEGMPAGALTPETIGRVVGALLPDNAILCDESITASAFVYKHTRAAAPHDYLQLTGGAIGVGVPLAAGAAVACPDRKVVAVQADGSGMYTIQGLWTQAREGLDVVTVVVSNRAYAILQGEMRGVGVNAVGEMAGLMLSLDRPDLDFVALARGMGVDGARAETAEDLHRLLDAALRRRGPFLIEAVV